MTSRPSVVTHACNYYSKVRHESQPRLHETFFQTTKTFNLYTHTHRIERMSQYFSYEGLGFPYRQEYQYKSFEVFLYSFKTNPCTPGWPQTCYLTNVLQNNVEFVFTSLELGIVVQAYNPDTPKSEVSVGFPGSGVPGRCELPDVGSGIVCTFTCYHLSTSIINVKLNGSIIDKSYPKLLNCYYLKIILTKNSLIGKCRHISTPFTKAQLQFLSIMHINKDSWNLPM